MSKIGRNSLCPCGSGKKYKKCCLNNSESTYQSKLKLLFQKYQKKSLLTFLGGLQVIPANHSQTIRLEVASRVACSLKEYGNEEVSPEILVKQLNTILTSNGEIGVQEDPPENLFTENIIFDGGNYVVYPGISDALYFLRRLIWVVRNRKENLPSEFRKKAYKSIILMLFLSNTIAQKASQTRNIESPNSWRENIVFDTSIAGTYDNAVIFNKAWLTSSLKSEDYLNILNEFCTTTGIDSHNIEDIFENPLIERPIVDLGAEIVVILPGSLMTSLRHYVLMLAKRFNVFKEIITECMNKIWVDNDECMRLLGYQPFELHLPPNNTGATLRESLFVADSDKLAYVVLAPDDGDGYEGVCGHCGAGLFIGEQIAKRAKEIWGKLSGRFGFSFIHVIAIPVGIGRSYGLGLGDLPPEFRVTFLSAEELETIAHLRDCDNLTLWKFTEALDGTYINPISSFIDKFALYRQQQSSFYAADDSTYSAIYMDIGLGLDLKAKAALIRDNHGVSKGTPPMLAEVTRKYDKDDIPIYFDISDKDFLVEGFKFPVWIRPAKVESNRSEARLFFDFSDTLAYWIWQITPYLSGIIPSVDYRPLSIEYELENIQHWLEQSEIDSEFIREVHVKYKYDHQYEKVILYISDSLIPILASPNNEGERIILSVLLDAFVEFASRRGIVLTPDKCQEIKEICAPLGMKKKFHCIPLQGTALWNVDLPKLRTLQEHDAEEQLNNLVLAIGEDHRQVGVIKSKKDKTSICQKIVSHFHKKIFKFMEELDSLSLIIELMNQYEAIINTRAFTSLTIPATLNCFFHQDNYLQELQKGTRNIDSTAIALRALIEVVASQPPKGTKHASTTDIDQLIAMMYHLVNWAMLSDNIHLNIIDFEMSILGSGRVGVEKNVIHELITPFYTEKLVERIEIASNRFVGRFDSAQQGEELESDIKNKYNKAFVAEFGFKVEEIASIFLLATNIGFNAEKSVYSMPVTDFIKKANEEVGWSSEKINKFIQQFSLEPRKKWETPPKGFTYEDIWPWRYNRKLSYVRRPFILTYNEDVQILNWGTRSIEDAGRQLFSVINNGRYKCDELTSQEMKELMGSINDELGRQFTSDLIQWLKCHTNLKTYSEVTIRPNGDLVAEADLGDIDVLAFDEERNIVYSFECKNINSGRNPREIANEIDRFVGDDQESKSWVQKHVERDLWLRENISSAIEKYQSKVSNPQVSSLMVVAEEIPTKYLRNTKLPFVSFPQLKREGLAAIN